MQKPIVIAGITFNAPLRYVEGHQLTGNEAAALNSLFHSDLAAHMRRIIGKEDQPQGGESFAASTIERLQSQFREAIERHNFAPKGPVNSFDPVQQLAMELALPALRAAIIKKGQTLDSFSKDEINELLVRAIEKHPRFRDEARTRLAAMRDAAEKVYGDA